MKHRVVDRADTSGTDGPQPAEPADRERLGAWGLAPALVALALTVSLPFLNPGHFPPIASFYEECLALGLGLLAIACIATRTAREPPAVPAIAVWTLALGLLFLAQRYWTPVPYAQPSTIAGLYALWAAALIWSGAQLRLAAPRRTAVVLAFAIVVGATGGAAAIWVQALDLNIGGWLPPLASGRASGLLGQPNLQANYLVVGGASLAYLWSERRLPTALALAIGAFLAAAVAFTGSRAAVLELGALLGVAWWFRGIAASEQRSFWNAVLMFSGLVLVAWAANSIEWSQLATSASGNGTSDRAVGVTQRLAIFEAAFRIWLSAPLLGVGIGGFTWAHYATPTPWSGTVTTRPEAYAHDVVLQLLAETGLIGAGLFVAAMLLWLRASLRRPEAGATPWHAWAVGVVSVELVHSLVEFPLWYAHFLGLTAVLMGFADRRAFELRSPLLNRGLPLGAAAIGAVLLWTTVHAHYTLTFWQNVPSEARADPAVRAAEEQSIGSLRRSLLGPQVEVLAASVMPVSNEDLDNRIAFAGRAMRYWPYKAIVQRQIVYLAMSGRDAEAFSLLEHMARLQPQTREELRTMVHEVPVAQLPADAPLRARLDAPARR